MPHNLYINCGVKNVYFFGVKNIEGQKHSRHLVDGVPIDYLDNIYHDEHDDV